MKRDWAICNVSVGGRYPEGQDRLRESALRFGFREEQMLLWRDEWPPGSPTHKRSPYAFKIAALEMALHRGFGATLWMDSSVWFIEDPAPVFKEIERNGYWWMTQGWNVSEWCSDEALPKLGINREDWRKKPLVAATVYGVDLRTDMARRYIGWMHARERDGCFRGPWRVDDGRDKDDPLKVRGHRHDQTALSVFIHKQELVMDWHPSYMEYQLDGVIPNPKAVMLARGL